MQMLSRLSLLLLVLGPTTSRAGVLELGGSLREQVDYVSDDTLGIGGAHDTVWQHRLLGHADWRPVAALRSYVELGAYAQEGRNGGASPVDASALDLQQGYLEWWPLSGAQLRLGRQEWKLGSGRLVSLRDGPNIRRAFDGALLETALGEGQLSARWGRPVSNRRHALDDRADEAQRLGGVQLTRPLRDGLKADFYALDYSRDRMRYAEGRADETRRSWGLRLFGARDKLDFNTEAVAQTGRWGGQDIRAWTLANDFGWTLTGVALQPRLGLKADVASGDSHPGDGRLETFSALYPNPSYFSEAGWLAPASIWTSG